MYTRRQFLATTTAAGLVALAAPHVARAATRVLRIASVSAESSPNGVGAVAMAAALKEKTGGSLDLQVFHASSLGKASDVIAGVKDSTIDMLVLAVDTMNDMPNEVMALTVPYLFAGKAAARSALDAGLRDYTLGSLKSVNMRGLAFGENGLRHVTARKPVRKVADLAGLKIRVPEAKTSIAAFAALGASPIPIPFKDLVPSMKAGLVEAQENPIANIVSAGMEGVQDHISLTSHIYSPALIAISEDIALELSESELQALEAAAAIGAEAARKANDDVDAKGLETMKANGWTVVDDVDTADFMSRSDAIHAACAEIVGADVLKQLKQLIA